MARLARVVAPGYPHHLPSPGLRKAGVTQRGNPRQRTFLSQRDYAAYLELMGGSGTVPFLALSCFSHVGRSLYRFVSVRFLSLASFAARAMMAEWRISGRAFSGTSAKSSSASTAAATGSIHSGG